MEAGNYLKVNDKIDGDESCVHALNAINLQTSVHQPALPDCTEACAGTASRS
jgi:hypothetical protein